MAGANQVRYGDIVGIRNTEFGFFMLVNPQLSPLAWVSGAVNPVGNTISQWKIQSAQGKRDGDAVESGDAILLVQPGAQNKLQAAQNPQTPTDHLDAAHIVGFQFQLSYTNNWYPTWEIGLVGAPPVTYESTFTLTMHFPMGLEAPYPGQLSACLPTRPTPPYLCNVLAINHALLAAYSSNCQIWCTR